MKHQSQFLNCYDLPLVSQLETVNYINTLFRAVGFLVLLSLLGLLVLYRAYHSTLQRLHLTLTIVTTLNTAVTVLNVELQFDVDQRSENQYSTWLP